MEPKRDAYDAIVIGSGMGGLTAGATLAKNGSDVLVVEQHDRPGGYAQSFKRKGFTFEVALHLTPGCGKGGLIFSILEDLGVENEIDFFKLDPFYRCIFPDFSLDVPCGLENYIETHAQRFPHEKEGLRALVSAMNNLYHEAMRMPPSLGFFGFLKMPKMYPHIVKYHKKNFTQMMGEYLTDEKLRGILSTPWAFSGLPPSKLSAIIMSSVIMSFIEDNAYYPKGGSKELANTLVKALEKYGGELLLKTKAERILVEKGKVKGVELSGGVRIGAKNVVSNTGARQTFGNLISKDQIKRKYLNRVESMRPSISAFEVFLGADLDIQAAGAAHETIAFSSYNHDENYSQLLQDPSGQAGIGICVPTLADSSLAPEGKHVVLLVTLAPFDIGKNWNDIKERAADNMIKKAGALIPGLSEHIVVKEAATPLTMQRYTLNDEGAAFGWEKSPDQVGRKALSPFPPIDGLYLAGHWSGSEHGIIGTMASGKRASSAILQKMG